MTETTELKPEGTQTEEHKEEVVQTPSPQETQARSQGWVPLEEWIEQGRDESEWKSPKVFLEHGEMIGRIRSQTRDLESMKQALHFANNQNVQAFEKGYANALTDLRQQKREALAAGDLVKADELDEKIDSTKEALNTARQQAVQTARAIPQPSKVDPEHLEWVKENPWYNEDRVMMKYADSLAVDYIQVNNGQVTPAQVRDFVAKEVQREFGDRINKTKRPQGAPNPEGDGRGTTGRQNSGSNSLDSKLARAKAEMTEEQRSIMKTIMKSTGMSEKKYLEVYSK